MRLLSKCIAACVIVGCGMFLSMQGCEPAPTQKEPVPSVDAGPSEKKISIEHIPTEQKVVETKPEGPSKKPVFSFPGEKVKCKPNPNVDALKSILAGGKNNPTGRGEQSGVYDPCNQRVILFGGNDFQPQQCADTGPKRFKQDTWMYSVEYKNWVRLQTPGAPQSRGRQTYTFDLSRKLIYIFGGRYRKQSAAGPYTLFQDLWAFDVNTDKWKEIVTKGDKPSARTNSSMVYDDINDQIILFGGNTSTSGLHFKAQNDTYILDLKTYTWTRIQTSPTPRARLFHALVMDGKWKRVIMYGGGGNNAFTGPFINDVWAFDLETKKWKQLWKPDKTSYPPARINPTLIEDRKNGRIVMFAGHDDTAIGHRNDLWIFDYTTNKWELKKAGDTGTGKGCASFCRCDPDFVEVDANSPERRQYHTFVHQVGTSQGILFGGKTDCGYIDDTWYLNFENFAWTKINDASQGEACKRTGRANCKELCY